MFKATMSLVPSEDKSSRRRQKRRRQKRSQFNKLRHTLGLLEVEQEDSHQQQGQKSLEQIIENEEAEGRLPDVVSMKRRKEIMGEDYDVMMIFHKMGMGLGRGSIPFDGAEETLTPKEKALLEKVMADEETDQRTIHDLSWEEIMAFSPTQRRIAEQAKNDWECRTERHEKHRQEQKEEQEKEEEKERIRNERWLPEPPSPRTVLEENLIYSFRQQTIETKEAQKKLVACQRVEHEQRTARRRAENEELLAARPHIQVTISSYEESDEGEDEILEPNR